MACTRADFISLGACFTQQNFSHHDQMALLVYRLAAISDVTAATTYLTTLTTTLLTDTNDATCGMTDDQIFAATLGVIFQEQGINDGLLFLDNLVGFGTSPISTKNGLATAIACLKNIPSPMLNKMVLYLICRIWSVINPL